MSRFLHTMLRVGDLERSVDFYTKAFGMKELRRRDVPDGKYTLAFVGYGDEDSNTRDRADLQLRRREIRDGRRVRPSGGRRAGCGGRPARMAAQGRRHGHPRQPGR